MCTSISQLFSAILLDFSLLVQEHSSYCPNLSSNSKKCKANLHNLEFQVSIFYNFEFPELFRKGVT